MQIATKLNRSHLVNGRSAYFLPCLGRTEEDIQASGPQTVTMEETLSCIHGSIARRKPASEHLRSELAIVAGLSKASLPPNPKVKWDDWVGDYGLVRDLIAETYPEEFYYPEMNLLIALSHRDEKSKTPANKSVPARIRA